MQTTATRAPRTPTTPRLVLLTLAALVVAAGLLVAPPSVQPAAAATASYRSTIGYSGPAGIYPYGMAYDPTSNTVLVGDYWNYRTQRFTAAGNHVKTMSNAVPGATPATGAGYGITVDLTDKSGGLASYWVAQQEQARIVQFDHSGKWLQTIGVGGRGTSAAHPGHAYAKGCGNGAMTRPTHIAIDDTVGSPTYGYLFVSDVLCKNSVYVFDHDGDFRYQLDWSGYRTAAQIFQATPRGIGIGADGNVYVAELNGKAVAVFTKAGRFLRTWQVPNQGSYGSGLADVRGLAMNNTKGTVYVVAAYDNCVFEFRQDTGAMLHKWCTTDGTKTGPALDSARYVAADEAGNVYVSDTWGNPAAVGTQASGYRVHKYAPGATATDPVVSKPWATGSQPPPNGGFNNNNGVAVDGSGSLFVTDQFEQRVQKFDSSKPCLSVGSCPAFQLTFGSRVANGSQAPGFSYPKAIATGAGRVWIGDQDGNAVVIYNPDGTFVHRFGDHGKAPGQFSGGVQGLAVTDDRVFAVDTGNCRLSVFDMATALAQAKPAPLTTMGGCGTGAGLMNGPRGLALNAAATKAYVVNTNTGAISIWDIASRTATSVTPTCSGSRLKLPVGAAFDPTHTWLYVADFGRQRVVRMAPDGSSCTTVTTGADTPEGIFKAPQYLAFDEAGTLYVSDKSRHVYTFAVTG